MLENLYALNYSENSDSLSRKFFLLPEPFDERITEVKMYTIVQKQAIEVFIEVS